MKLQFLILYETIRELSEIDHIFFPVFVFVA